MTQEVSEEEFETDRNAMLAFFSSAIARGSTPLQAKYKSADDFAEEAAEVAEAVALKCFARFKALEKACFPFDPIEDDDEEEEEEDEDERPRRRRVR